MVGMRTHGEEVRANFGIINVSQLQPQQLPRPLPFKTDFAALKAQFGAQTMGAIRSMVLPAAAGGRRSALLPAMVFDYLTHHRWALGSWLLFCMCCRLPWAGASDVMQCSTM